MVERLVWDQEVEGSNPFTPTTVESCTARQLLLEASQRSAAADSGPSKTARIPFVSYSRFLSMTRPLALVLSLGAVVSSLLLAGLRAQVPALPEPDAAPSAGAPEPTPLPSVPPPILLPDELLRPTDPGPAPAPNTATIPQLDESFKPAPLSPLATQQQLQIGWRKLRNRVQNDASVKAMLAHAEAAPNDLEKRRRLTKFYEFFYGKMIALADTPELKRFVTDRRNEYLAALKQPRVRPEPATPAPKIAANAAATPGSSVAPSPSISSLASPSPTPASLFPSVFGTPRPDGLQR